MLPSPEETVLAQDAVVTFWHYAPLATRAFRTGLLVAKARFVSASVSVFPAFNSEPINKCPGMKWKQMSGTSVCTA